MSKPAMPELWLTIERESGYERRNIKSIDSVGLVEGACPGCGASPFYVVGRGATIINHDTCRAGGVAKCCGDSVGYIYAKVDTLFGTEEDRAVLTFGRARVYGGGIRP